MYFNCISNVFYFLNIFWPQSCKATVYKILCLTLKKKFDFKSNDWISKNNEQYLQICFPMELFLKFCLAVYFLNEILAFFIKV